MPVEHDMETLTLTSQQSVGIANLPGDYRVVGVADNAPIVRKPTGQIMRIRQDGRLTAASGTAKRGLADVRSRDGVTMTNPYTSVMD